MTFHFFCMICQCRFPLWSIQICQVSGFHYGQSSAKYKNNITKNDMYLSLADYHVTSIKFVGKCIHMELFESRDQGIYWKKYNRQLIVKHNNKTTTIYCNSLLFSQKQSAPVIVLTLPQDSFWYNPVKMFDLKWTNFTKDQCCTFPLINPNRRQTSQTPTAGFVVFLWT